MENRNLFLGIIGLLILAVVGLAVDRSNQIATLTDQAATAADRAQESADNMAGTIEAQVADIDLQAQAVTAGEEAIQALETQIAVSSTAFEEEISEISSAAQVLEEQNENFVTQVADLTTGNTGLATEVADLVSDNDTLATQVAQGATVASELSIQATELADTLEVGATVEANNTILSIQVAEGENTIATLQAENSALMTQIAEMQPTATATPEPQADLDIESSIELSVENRGVVEISPDSASIAILRTDNVIELFASDGSSQGELTGFEEDVDSFIFSNDGQSIAVVSNLNRVRVIDITSDTVLLDEVVRNPVRSYDFAGDDGALIVQTGLESQIFPFEPAPSVMRIGGVALDWSNSGSRIVTTDGDIVEILVMDGYEIDSVIEAETEGDPIVHIEFSPDGSRIVAFTAEAKVIVWNSDGEKQWSSQTSAGTIADIGWAGDGSHLAVVTDSDVRIYSSAGVSTQTIGLSDVTDVEWSADSMFIVTASGSEIHIIAADTFTE